MRWQAVARWLPALSAGWRLAHCSERRLQAAPAVMHRRLSTSGPLPCMWNRPATGHEAPPFGTVIEAFGTGRASRFVTEAADHRQELSTFSSGDHRRKCMRRFARLPHQAPECTENWIRLDARQRLGVVLPKSNVRITARECLRHIAVSYSETAGKVY